MSHTPKHKQILLSFWVSQTHSCAAKHLSSRGINTPMPPISRQDRARKRRSLFAPDHLERQAEKEMSCLWQMLPRGCQHVPAHATASEGTTLIATAAAARNDGSPRRTPLPGPPAAGQSRRTPAPESLPWSVRQREKECQGHVQGAHGWREAPGGGVD